MNFGGGPHQGLEGHLGLRPGHRRHRQVVPTAELVARLKREYAAARQRLQLAAA
jgi:nitronate monooxygenase